MLVQTHALTKRYGRVTALDRCTLAVAEGEIFGLLGPNGSGKTTLLRLLMGYLRPSGGSGTIDGLDCYRQSVLVHERVAYLPGEAKLSPQMRGRDVLAFFAGIRPDGNLPRALSLADRLALELSRPVSLMSTGMRQKTALAAVLASSARILILDEPTANLDPTARSEVLAIVSEARAAGKTILFSSHVLGEVEETCDRVVILRRGEVVHQQIMHELRRQHRIRARLTGPLPTVPEHFNGALRITQPTSNDVLIDTPGELAPLLGWLATMPLAEVRIEPVHLQTVYEQFHGGRALMSGSTAQLTAGDKSRTRSAPARGVLNRALWTKAVRESWSLLASLVVLLFAFAWVYVWLISKIEVNALAQFLLRGLKDLERLSGVPFEDVATPAGRVALAFVDPLVHLGVVVWAISRGSDAVSGELERGTLEMLVAQPVSRLAIYFSKAVVAVVGLVLISIALWGGLGVGVTLIVKETDQVWPAMYVAPTINVFGLGFAMAGVAALVSSCDRYRWRTIGIMGAFYAVAVILKVIARMAPGWEAVGYTSIFWPFEPQRMVADHANAWRLLVEYNTPLVLVGIASYLAGAIIFCRRDLPAPL